MAFIDQTELPCRFRVKKAGSSAELVEAIKSMKVRGAPLIGATGAWAAAFACGEAGGDEELEAAFEGIESARPTAVNLRWGVDRVRKAAAGLPRSCRREAAAAEAARLCDEDAETNRRLGEHFKAVVEETAARLGRPVSILTHCNAGWLATVDYGTALSGVYQAHAAGVPLRVIADETRPRLQGLLTEWELRAAGVPCAVVCDNAGGLLMQEGKVDLVVVGADRIAANGDTANKIGTYLKALAARDCGVPFYVAAPFSTVDLSLPRGLGAIPIEERSGDEIRVIPGAGSGGTPSEVRVAGSDVPVLNPAFDITPASLVTGIVTERGIFAPEELADAAGRKP